MSSVVASTPSIATAIVEANRFRPDVIVSAEDGEIRELVDHLTDATWNANVVALCSDSGRIRSNRRADVHHRQAARPARQLFPKHQGAS